MTLIEKLKEQSANFENVENDILDEIENSFKEFIRNGSVDSYIEKRLDNDSKKNRSLVVWEGFWEHQAGCSGTHFHCCGFVWKNPDVPEYEYKSRYYKGVTLHLIAERVLLRLYNLLEEYLREQGFNVSRQNENRCVGIEYKIKISW